MSRARHLSLFLFPLSIGLALPATSALASPEDDARLPTPVAPLASQGQVSAITRNPALLGAIGRWELELGGYHGRKGPNLGTGFSAFGGFRLGKNFALAMGFARRLEGVKRQAGINTLIAPASELSFGFALGDPNQLAFGASIHTTYSYGQKLRAPDLQAGLVARFGPYLALGSSFRHRPRYAAYKDQSLRSHSRWSNELALRPFGTHWLELAGSSFLDTRRSVVAGTDLVRSDWRWGGRLSGTYRNVGLDVVARQRILANPNIDVSDHMNPLYDREEWQWGLQLRVQTRNLAAYLSGRMAQGSAEAYALKLRMGPGIGPESSQSWIHGPRKTLVLDLDKVSNDYDLIRVLEALRKARGAHRPPVLVQGRFSGLGWASAMELRKALCAYKTAGGRVFAHLDSGNLATYYLATVAEQIYVAPTADLGLYEPGRTSLYFKQALDRLSISSEWLHTGPYKSAFERFTQDGPSAPDIEQRERLYRLISGEVLRAVAQSRPQILGQESSAKTKTASADDKSMLRQSAGALQGALGKSPLSAPLAKDLGLADKVAYLDKAEDAIAKTLGVSHLNTESLTDFPDPSAQARPWGTRAYIGVVVVQGTIVSGEGFELPLLSNRFAGDASFAAELSALASDPNCYGVIIRVNSPGGSAVASDRMWKAVHDFVQDESKSTGRPKPLVVSMGDAAASGGYYLSAPAPQIFAQPLTLTGSIGVTALHWDLSALATRVGVQTHNFGSSQARSPNSPFRPWTPAQRENMERSIQDSYDLFVTKVHEGRDLPKARVLELAGGRVWSGYDAKPRKLVDAWGGYEQARAWILQRLKPSQTRQPIGVRVLEPAPGFLSARLSALSQRLGASRDKASTNLLVRLMQGLARHTLAGALLDLVMLPQDASLTWSSEAHSATRMGKPK